MGFSGIQGNAGGIERQKGPPEGKTLTKYTESQESGSGAGGGGNKKSRHAKSLLQVIGAAGSHGPKVKLSFSRLRARIGKTIARQNRRSGLNDHTGKPKAFSKELASVSENCKDLRAAGQRGRRRRG